MPTLPVRLITPQDETQKSGTTGFKQDRPVPETTEAFDADTRS